jgi:DNA-binding NarL/FixJ family response regulator
MPPASRTLLIPCHVLLADNQAIFRAGIARVLDGENNITVLGQCGTAAQMLELVAGTRGSVLVLAESLEANMDRVFAAAQLTNTRVILLTETPITPAAPEMRRLDGLLTRQASAADLLNCVQRVNNGERILQSATKGDSAGDQIRDMLSTRELQIVGLVVQGLKNRKIAEDIGTSEQVVKNYLRTIYDKTGSSDRLELALFTLHHRPLAEAAARAAQAITVRTAIA